MTVQIDGSVALLTGANRGLGAAFCPPCSNVARPRSTPAPASPRPPPGTLLVSNAGISGGSALAEDALEVADAMFKAADRVHDTAGNCYR